MRTMAPKSPSAALVHLPSPHSSSSLTSSPLSLSAPATLGSSLLSTSPGIVLPPGLCICRFLYAIFLLIVFPCSMSVSSHWKVSSMKTGPLPALYIHASQASRIVLGTEQVLSKYWLNKRIEQWLLFGFCSGEDGLITHVPRPTSPGSFWLTESRFPESPMSKQMENFWLKEQATRSRALCLYLTHGDDFTGDSGVMGWPVWEGRGLER